MKTVLLFLLTAFTSIPSVFAQIPIDLPIYKVGEYSRDTIESFLIHESMSFKIGGTLTDEFITGVSFKILLDSVQFPGSSSAGGSSIHKGDIFPLPVDIQLFNGVIRVRLIIDGTPQVGEESYLCDLGLLILTDANSDIFVSNISNTTCTVNNIQANETSYIAAQPQFYPNPFSISTLLKVDELSPANCTLLLFDKQGTLLLSQSSDQGKIQLNKNDLQTGMYFYQLKNEQTILKTGKLLVE